MGVARPLEGVRTRNSFILGTSLVSTLGLGYNHKSYRGTSPKSTRALRETVLERRGACKFVSTVGEAGYTLNQGEPLHKFIMLEPQQTESDES